MGFEWREWSSVFLFWIEKFNDGLVVVCVNGDVRNLFGLDFSFVLGVGRLVIIVLNIYLVFFLRVGLMR